MQRIAILLFLLAVAGGVWYLIDQESPEPASTLPGDGVDPAGANGQDPAGMRGANRPVSDDALPELLKLTKPARALLIGKHQGTWPAQVLEVFLQIRELEFRSWYTHDIESHLGAEGEHRGMTALGAGPTGDYLQQHDVQVLYLDMFDPNALPQEFWNVVAERVNAGRMGLCARPTYLIGEDGVGVTAHPMLSHPTLKTLLPVARGALVQGSPPLGVYTDARPLRVTALGLKHPATRMVANTKAAAKSWERAGAGTGAFVTKFCYPVEELVAGAQVLVEVEAATSVPAIVVGPASSKARVLWMGTTDFGQPAYYNSASDALMKLLINHWTLWLLGQHGIE
ncbi:MAG: hypothetical protein O2894_11010 [Planctomycetota bacterium]|nr:hypothetical protein [Planctomycetota bacterium]